VCAHFAEIWTNMEMLPANIHVDACTSCDCSSNQLWHAASLVCTANYDHWVSLVQ
jgi:hypothetical protein